MKHPSKAKLLQRLAKATKKKKIIKIKKKLKKELIRRVRHCGEEYTKELPFRFREHKKYFSEEPLDVIILSDGSIEYTHPNLETKLIKIACDKLNITEHELFKQNTGFEKLIWLFKKSKCIHVYNHTTNYYNINKRQINTLHNLQDYGFYSGEIPTEPVNHNIN